VLKSNLKPGDEFTSQNGAKYQYTNGTLPHGYTGNYLVEETPPSTTALGDPWERPRRRRR
jgi:hypothetical protein